MLNSNEVNEAEMPLGTLTMFNYITHGQSSDVEYDYDMLSETELDFDN